MHDTIICYCKNVSKQTIVEAIRSGATTLQEIQQTTTACTGNRCKELHPEGICCSRDIKAIIQEVTGNESPAGCCCCH